MVCESLGLLWLLSCLFSSFGTMGQISHNHNRRSVSGLSLFDSEVRFYGKIPWVLFACALGAVDWWILLANGLGIVLALIILAQFLVFSSKSCYLRIIFAFSILILILGFATLCNLSEYQGLATYSPVLVSLILMPKACWSQYLQNMNNACSGVRFSRYFMYLLSNFCALAYGAAKIETLGIDYAWPLVFIPIVGICTNTILLIQIMHAGQCPAILINVYSRVSRPILS